MASRGWGCARARLQPRGGKSASEKTGWAAAARWPPLPPPPMPGCSMPSSPSTPPRPALPEPARLPLRRPAAPPCAMPGMPSMACMSGGRVPGTAKEAPPSPSGAMVPAKPPGPPIISMGVWQARAKGAPPAPMELRKLAMSIAPGSPAPPKGPAGGHEVPIGVCCSMPWAPAEAAGSPSRPDKPPCSRWRPAGPPPPTWAVAMPAG
mmetsp:Transcript_1630/g.4592  ORF Transcript_1630/g.4592 Transcript_1630/m.4592 type:complete len:207 (+) Transcript_1630:314-934(+)